jgi:hypothetical protein
VQNGRSGQADTARGIVAIPEGSCQGLPHGRKSGPSMSNASASLLAMFLAVFPLDDDSHPAFLAFLTGSLVEKEIRLEFGIGVRQKA